MNRQDQQPDNLGEEYCIETPIPPQFQPYEEGSAAISYRDEGHNNNNAEPEGDEFVRHGRSPRFWFLVVGALVLVVAAVGAGVGVALSGGGSSSGTPNKSSTYDRPQVEEELAEEFYDGLEEEKKENKETGQAGNVVQFGDGNGAGNGNSPAPTTEVYDIILTHSRYHGVEFKDPNSYQSKAVRWVEQTAQLTVHTTARLVQRYALACIYYATNGVENVYTKEIFGAGNTRPWIDETGWLVDDDECNWYQVECDINGVVTKIQLFSNRLSGSFPPEVALLKSSLKVIDLYQNLIHNKGEAGNHFLGELTELEELFFGRTYFEYDGIPTAIGLLTKLEEFDCSYTLYHGALRGDAFRLLNSLEYLHIGGNEFNSTIPSELAALPKLQYLYAEYSDIRGGLGFVQNMPEIVELWVDRNPLGGSIPSAIGLVDSLKSFSVTGCDLEGTIPKELANLRLQQFWAYNNSLVGTIPTEFGGLDSLIRLGLEKNNLNGNMPNEICQNRVPNGLLMKLEADCEAGGSVTCACCTCCGAQCAGLTSTGGRRLNNKKHRYIAEGHSV